MKDRRSFLSLPPMWCALLCSCGGAADRETFADETQVDSGEVSADRSGRLIPPGPGAGIQLESKAVVAPGAEATVCQYFVVPPEGLNVVRFEHDLGPGSHHMIVWPVLDVAAGLALESGLEVSCVEALEKTFGLFVYNAERGRATLPFPHNVSQRFEGGSVLVLEHHVVNTETDELLAHATLNMWTSPEPRPLLASMLHFYNFAISIPPLSAAVSRMRCVMPSSATLLFGHGHMHRRGDLFRAMNVGKRTFIETRYGESGTKLFEPPVDITQGDVIEFECDYRNDESRFVYQGLSAKDDEMCSLSASFVTPRDEPLSLDARVCATVGSSPLGAGTDGFDDLDACLGSSVDAYLGGDPSVVPTCWMAACPDTTIKYMDYARCRELGCAAPCETVPGTLGVLARASRSRRCQACVNDSCAPALSDARASCL